ncbi:MAG TPA: glycosyltransferase family 2 protein [Kiritimatiellia bacterium]|nr:glycosyltransferase family 2 protein [Kiritimatiellia bacterium]
MTRDMTTTPQLSVLLPAYNEEACIADVVREVADVLRGVGRPFEIVVVDDGSTDATPERLGELQAGIPELRVLRLRRNSGQSAALGAAFRAARGEIFVTLDADGQNDPADIPALLAQLATCDLCCGYRAKRQDTWSKRFGSRLANAVRNRALHETIRDTGCTLKAFRAEWTAELPMQFRGMHRFLPALMAMAGARIAEIPVNHRPRAAGQSKYTNWGRLKETLWDLWAVRWMQKRYRSRALASD